MNKYQKAASKISRKFMSTGIGTNYRGIRNAYLNQFNKEKYDYRYTLTFKNFLCQLLNKDSFI